MANDSFLDNPVGIWHALRLATLLMHVCVWTEAKWRKKEREREGNRKGVESLRDKVEYIEREGEILWDKVREGNREREREKEGVCVFCRTNSL
jgi:hypothetical protein